MYEKETVSMETPTKDLYRDTPVRYLGYANEVGEAFRKIIGGKWVAATYGVATLYVLADTYDKSSKCHDGGAATKKVVYTAADTLLWQMLASVAIPGLTINRVCAASAYLLKNNKNLGKMPKKWAVTAIGLATIPIIIKPIDHMVDTVLDNTFRKLSP
ncbi:PREDICTED: mitochondrial fission process protein 1 [Nicrophorus vespilloides]|uniref:Mitochondrial fission process protein 1 n=1 Tax=Nicrophorus vespilloides TaxID=110193 RepID=A0ABM1M3P7_NICVS|nr:PREDICTED: mitochondrial fission process protein 1 [Nicrophorus vespilloides]